MSNANNAPEALVYDWNEIKRTRNVFPKAVELFDETLRDGLQSPSVVDPPIEVKKEIVELMAAVGITMADIGLPGAGQRAIDDVTAITAHIRDRRLPLQVACAARTVIKDIEPVVRIRDEVGVPIVVYAFLGTSPVRLLAEDWDMDRLLRSTEEAIGYAVQNNLELAFVTEDTTRTPPATLDVPNALFAAEYGVDRIHGTAMGIGERVGNTALDQVILNLKLMGAYDHDVSKLVAWCRTVAEATRVEIPVNYPLVGGDAFRTATGVHAAAVIKAEKKGDRFGDMALADVIYSGVPAGWFGREQEIEVGHMSGMSNVRYWLEKRRVPLHDDLLQGIFTLAKSHHRTLRDDEIWDVVRAHERAVAAATTKT